MMMTSRLAILGLVRMGREVRRRVAFGTRCWAVDSGGEGEGEGGRNRKWFSASEARSSGSWVWRGAGGRLHA